SDARHRRVRRAHHILNDAGRDRAHAPPASLRDGRRVRARQRRTGLCRDPSGDIARPPRPGDGMTALVWVSVALLGGMGSVARFLVDRAVSARAAGRFPLGTFTVNILGASVLGLITAMTLSHDVNMIAGTATIGAFTTFSTWMYETHRLAEERRFLAATANIALSIAAGIAAAAAGYAVGGSIWPRIA